jgi:hypothetical protein
VVHKLVVPEKQIHFRVSQVELDRIQRAYQAAKRERPRLTFSEWIREKLDPKRNGGK